MRIIKSLVLFSSICTWQAQAQEIPPNSGLNQITPNYQSKFFDTNLPEYYAVIFTIQLNEDNLDGYAIAEKKMQELSEKFDGYLGSESVDDGQGFSLFISYWRNLEDIERFKNIPIHVEFQDSGKHQWFKKYTIRVAHITKQYGGELK